MKIGIYTITEGENYGNRLQNYALQKTLEKRGYDVRTILDKKYKYNTFFKLKNTIKKITGINDSRFAKRCRTFNKFNNEYIKFAKTKINNGEILKNINEYDCFIAGSDQIWNPNFGITTPASFLKFADGKKKISVAASFGVTEITDIEIRQKYKEYLQDFSAISVREKSGVKIVKDLTGKEASVLIDPTLMLSREEWYMIAKRPPKVPDKKYIFCYFLGEYEQNILDEMYSFAKAQNMEVVLLENDWCQLGISSDEEFCINPSEFIWLISHCEKVITDSFHAVIFSIVFKKRVVAIPRDAALGDMNNRLTDLAEEFKIKNLVNYDFDFESEAKINFDEVDKILKEKQKEFSDYLDNSLNG